MRTLARLVFAGLLAGCTTSANRTSCLERDWYEIGRRDGARGLPLERFTEYQRECRADLGESVGRIYVNGRNAGLVEYCQPDSAFALGRVGLRYAKVCPATLESEFLEAYQRGESARRLEVETKALTAQITAIQERLARVRDHAEQRRLSDELNRLYGARARVSERLDHITR